MRKTDLLSVLLLASLSLMPGHGLAAPSRPETVHHDLKVMLMPASTLVTAEDTITLGAHVPVVAFSLHADLSLMVHTPGVEVVSRETTEGAVPVASYRLKIPDGTKSFTVSFQGKIVHPVKPVGREQARGFSSSPGIISPEGVYLAGSTVWYPVIEGTMVSFGMTVTMPEGWSSVSQGARTDVQKENGMSRATWSSPEPQDEIFLVAGRFHEYAREGVVSAMAFLRLPDHELAAKYLDATETYVSLYDRLIGPYPYRKFALVENFWETGFGMPSFTLLGPKVIRLPFIINSSYPHEILHNWWGNGVFPVYESGNWSEGLTAYLADHLIKEQEGTAAEYRYSTLQKYADYVLANRDFPLSRFTSRKSTAEEAVGYGKSLMFFHMLRGRLGDQAFVSALRDFYREHRFGFASFTDLRTSFERSSRLDLSQDFRQLVEEAGAPELRLASAEASPEHDGFTLSLQFEQTQNQAAYRLRIPVSVALEGAEAAYQTFVEMDAKKMLYRIHLPSRPTRVDVDPEFDLFRRLDRKELPPAITHALGSKRLLVVLPSKADPGLFDAYRDLARAFTEYGPESVSIYIDREVMKFPDDRAVVVLGSDNLLYAKALASMKDLPVETVDAGFVIDGRPVLREDHAVVIAGRLPSSPDSALLLITADRAEMIQHLTRKLPHYHKYSFLAFKGPEAENVLKGRWQVTRSPLTALLAGTGAQPSDAARARLAPRKPLSDAADGTPPPRMAETVRALESPEMEGRGLGTSGLDRASVYLAEGFRDAGLKPHGEKYLQEWREEISGLGPAIALKNVVGIVPGGDPVLSKECVVTGAHYDHLGTGWPESRAGQKGKYHPGADDNASGVSVLLALGREFASGQEKLPRSLVFVAFTGEEAEKLGSRHFVETIGQYCPDGAIAMLNLDTIGRLKGKKLYVIGSSSSTAWEPVLEDAGASSGLDTKLVRENLDSSDQTSFHEAGIPAVQFFTGPHEDYHRPTDTAEKLNYEGMQQIVSFVKTVIGHLGRRTEPLLFTASEQPAPKKEEPKTERRAGLGIVPDFAFQGKGCRVGGVITGSPAEAAGMKQGDVVTAINDQEITGLKELSAVLKLLEPGQRIEVRFLRDGREMSVETSAAQR